MNLDNVELIIGYILMTIEVSDNRIDRTVKKKKFCLFKS